MSEDGLALRQIAKVTMDMQARAKSAEADASRLADALKLWQAWERGLGDELDRIHVPHRIEALAAAVTTDNALRLHKEQDAGN